MNSQAIASLTLQLQKALDSNYDVTDMQTVLFVIQQLEGATITQEQLETTRLAKYINQLRRRTISETLARRAKNLLKKWRDMVMPALHQPGASSTTAGRSTLGPHHHQSHSQPPMSFAVASAAAQPLPSPYHPHHGAQQQQHPVAHSFTTSSSSNKIQTGSANNNNNTGKINSLSNGGQHYSSFPGGGGVSQAGGATAAAAGPITTIDLSQSATISDVGKFHHNKKLQQQSQQPISFANLITSHSQPPTSYDRNSNVAAAGPSSTRSPTAFIDITRRSESPTLPRITRMMNEQQQQQHQQQLLRQSPVSLLDFDSNPSSRSRVVSPAVAIPSNLLATNNNTPSKKKPVVNGNVAGIVAPVPAAAGAAASAYDFHDSNSTNTLDISAAAASSTASLLSALHQAQQSQQHQQVKCYSAPPPAIVPPDTHSSSSNHRKSKKHKKDKKRNKSSPNDKSTPPSVGGGGAVQQNAAATAQLTTSSSAILQYVEEIPAACEETVVAGSAVFPPHDSLSSSSMSLFPSTSTNTMMIQNTSRMLLANNYGSTDATTHTVVRTNESDLTFAGKFKSSNTIGLGDIPSIPSSTNNSSFDTVLSAASLSATIQAAATKKSQSGKDGADLIVVVESRSCSPFARFAPDDTCSSSSRTTIPDIVSVINQDSINQGAAAAGDDPKLQPTIDKIRSPVKVVPAEIVPTSTAAVVGPKKRGRKKGSRGIDAVIAQTHAFLNTSMFERPRLLFAGSKKVKTTKELLADIQSRKLGSSVTSSPTLASNRQSASPSTCSEASFQSDITSTRTSSLNPRLSPEFNAILSNCRQSDLDDMNSATDSNDGLSKPPTDLKADTVPTASGTTAKSVDEYLDDLKKQLPPIDYSKLHWNRIGDSDPNDTVICTCTVHEVEPTAALPPKEEVVFIKSDDDETETLTCSAVPIVSRTVVPVVVPSSVKKSPKKPIKSIFDLDYDDDNDPLHTFVEAARLRGNEAPVTAAADATEDDNTNGSGAGALVAVNSVKKSEKGLSTSSAADSVQSTSRIEVQQAQLVSAAAVLQHGNQNGGVGDAEPITFQNPIYEVVEDENCLAKYRYDIQTNCITEYHINALHNLYIPNVNGNWSAAIPAEAEHRTKLRNRSKSAGANTLKRRRRRRSSQSSCSSGGGGNSNCSSRRNDDKDEELFERVVPQYDHIIMDKVRKDLSHIKFTKNYQRKMLKRKEAAALIRLAAESEAAVAAAADSNQTGSFSSNKNKRKRLQSSSVCGNSKDDAGDGDDVKHKHQRRRKHKKLPDTNLETSTCINSSLSRVKREEDDDDEEEEEDGTELGEGGDGNEEYAASCDDIVMVDVMMNDKPKTFTDETDNACDVDVEESHGAIGAKTMSVRKREEEEENCGTDDNDRGQFKDIMESSSNQMSTDYDDEYIDDDDDDDDDEDLDDIVDNDIDEEHEVVTHDMTSSTSTTSQQHIVLTIKKKIVKTSDDNDNSLSTPLPASAAASASALLTQQLSATSTEIKTRRKNQHVESETTSADDDSAATDAIIVDNDKILDIFDNNNVKINLNNSMAVSSDDNVCTTTADNLVKNLMSSNTTILPHKQQQQQQQLNDETATDNFNSLIINLSSSNNIKISNNKKMEKKSFDYDDDNVRIDGMARRNEQQQSAKAISDDDDVICIDDCTNDTIALSSNNNDLLRSFNSLTDDNRIGLRLKAAAADNDKIDVTATAATATATVAAAATNQPVVIVAANDEIQEFREWHEVLHVRSYNDELLTILPYVVID